MKPSKNRKTKSRQTKAFRSIDPNLQQSLPIPNENLNSSSQSRSRDVAYLSDAFSCLSVDQIESTYDEAGCNLEVEDHLPNPNAVSTASVEYSSFQRNWDLMKMFFQWAAMEFSRGNHSHAAFLVEEGNYYRRLARMEHEEAILEIFRARNRAINNTITIDLQGLHVKYAINMLKRHLMALACLPSVGFLKVITGCGENGVGKGKMKRSVKSLATRENIEWSEENPGTILLKIGGMEYTFTDSDIDVE